MGKVDRLTAAANAVLGVVPPTWSNLFALQDALDALPPIVEGRKTPITTYLYFVIREYGVNQRINYPSALMDEKMIQRFESSFDDMHRDATLVAKLDVANFVVEVDMFKSPAHAIKTPTLAITPLYRYLACQEHALQFMIGADLVTDACRQLRINPFMFFEYGDDAMSLMPTTWEDL